MALIFFLQKEYFTKIVNFHNGFYNGHNDFYHYTDTFQFVNKTTFRTFPLEESSDSQVNEPFDTILIKSSRAKIIYTKMEDKCF